MTFNDIDGYPLAYPPDPAGFGGNIDYFTKIMGFSFIASLFQGFGTPFNTTGGGVGTGGATYSYVWNTIRLLLLGLLVETGRNFCQWLIQRISFRSLSFHDRCYLILNLHLQNTRSQPNLPKAIPHMNGSSCSWYDFP